MDASPTVVPAADPPARPVTRLRRRLLLALAVHVAMTTFLALDGVDRLAGDRTGPFDPSAYVFPLVLALPVVLALLGTALPGRAPRPTALVAGVLGVAVALLLLPLYGLGSVLLPGAAVGLWAALVRD